MAPAQGSAGMPETPMTDLFQSEDERWHAVLNRDPRADGAFWYGVRTTGIFCRPVCPSRRPKRENVSFHASSAMAQAAGFRACRRCGDSAAPR